MDFGGFTMLANITIPKLGVNVTEFRLVEWKAKEGDWAEKGSIVLEIETEKTQWEVEAEISGFLHILIAEGNKAEVGTVVGVLAETNEELKEVQKESPIQLMSTEAGVKEIPSKEPPRLDGKVPIKQKEKRQKSVRITPVARKIAEEHMVDITHIRGTGPGGRIIRKDVEASIIAKEKAGAPPSLYHGRRVQTTEPLKGMRASIAEHMYRSLSSSAQMTVMGELDMGKVVRLRENLLRQEESIGVRIGYVDIMVFIIASALKVCPSINCSLIDNEIKIWEDINVGVAVALGEEGLIVPVVKSADKKSLIEIAQTVSAMKQKAQARTLLPDEVTGGTFTLTTVGRQSESRFQTPILNEPEAAILGIGAIEDRAMVRDGQIVIRPIMPYSFTFDHRMINGFGAEQFMRKIREFVEAPDILLLY
jgi:pyruvate dehydrogenase E2 component (dihydrolipoamide acetyltransferase)